MGQTGFMFTAAIPSLSDTSGYKFVLMLVHNVCAPFATVMCAVMETVQLSYGECAFSFFFSLEPATVFGPLTLFQRLRVITVILAWSAATLFLTLQVYLGLGTMVGLRIHTSYSLSLISLFAEVYFL